ncbi:alkene reductase [Caballeronia megalochromosomata]|nr:alkene reductase [Caballeronia megalochromosomata]
MPYDSLLSPFAIGNLQLPNRVVMAPLTRNRASQPGDVPSEMNAHYYAQRASAGLIVTEATQVSRQGQGYFATPGIYSDPQEAGWRAVVGAVHARHGRIASQLWHVGRVSHRSLQEGGAPPVAPSAVRARDTQVFVKHDDGSYAMTDADDPRALETDELPGIVLQFVDAAHRAKRAGFDMIEVHAANGYLLHQFMATGTNHRTDDYGGSIENRVRLVVEVLEAVAGVMGANRVGIRISPNFTGFDLQDDEGEASSLYLAQELKRIGIAYLHLAEGDWTGGAPLSEEYRRALRQAYPGAIIVCGEYTAEEANARIERGEADAVAFGRAYIANPDLVERFSADAPLNTPDEATFYGGGEKGYTDYPALDEPGGA